MRSNNTYSWYRMLATLWVTILALQWVDFTEPLWYKETTALVTATLLTVAIIDVLPLRPLWSWLLKLAGVMVGWWFVLVNYYIYEPDGRSFVGAIFGIVSYLTPYVWFSLTAWLVFELARRFVTTQKHILMLLGVLIISFTILDSFSPYKCWHNVAWTVFAGLGWLSTLHFRTFQLKFPKGWRSLYANPLNITLNIIIIMSCVLLIGISMPSVTPLLTDPYTAWVSRDGAASVKLVAAEEDESLEEEESAKSGYSRDDSKLGDGFEFKYSPVMTVNTSIRSYWRGETRRIYTGDGWASLPEEDRSYRTYSGSSTGEMALIESPNIQKQRLEQVITMESGLSFPVLFGAYHIRSIEPIVPDNEPLPEYSLRWAAEQAELHFDERNDAYPKKYKVISEVPLIPLEEIRMQSYEEIYAGGIDSQYLQIPTSFPTRVKDLAQEVTASADTPYEKMELLEAYLKDSFEYTNKPDLSLRQSEDFVDSFLFETRQGYCDYFSTSMVMMARSLGVPARWVKGYAPGRLPVSDFLQGEQIQVDSGTYKVSDSDAHSWVELYFGDYGWISFEPTPGFESTVMYVNENNDVIQAMAMEEEKPEESASIDTFAGLDMKMLRIIFIVTLLIVIAGIIYWSRHMIARGMYRSRLRRKLTPGEKIAYETIRLTRQLSRKGFSRQKHQTMRESFACWASDRPELAETLESLLYYFEKSRYSNDACTDEHWKKVQLLCRQLLTVARKRMDKI